MPLSTIAFRLQCVAARTLIFTRCGRVLPSDKISPCSRKRNSLGCKFNGSSPISSKNSVPPSAAAIRPGLASLAPVNAPYFDGADLLIAADCTAYAYGNFHRDFMRSRITLIGCPKLDGVDYAEKLTEILKRNHIRSITVARMEVPCCGGMERAATQALQNSGKFIPWQVVTISTGGRIVD